MKTKLVILIIAIIPLMFFNCQKPEFTEDAKTNSSITGDLKILEDICGEPVIGTLTDWDQTVNVGNFIISNDEDSLYVTFVATGDWEF